MPVSAVVSVLSSWPDLAMSGQVNVLSTLGPTEADWEVL